MIAIPCRYQVVPRGPASRGVAGGARNLVYDLKDGAPAPTARKMVEGIEVPD